MGYSFIIYNNFYQPYQVYTIMGVLSNKTEEKDDIASDIISSIDLCFN